MTDPSPDVNAAPAHPTKLELDQSPPAEVEAGTTIALSLRVSCDAGCDLEGTAVHVLDEAGALITEAPLEPENQLNDLELRAPSRVGATIWSLVFPECLVGEVVHERSTLIVRSETIPHTTSAAVWEVPSPVVMSSPFSVRVGVKCSASCDLSGQSVRVRDEDGVEVGEGILEETPWQGTEALYSVEVPLEAPEGQSSWSWSVQFTSAATGLPHAESSANFTFRTANPPDHSVAVKVIQEDTNDPLEGAHVRLGLYRGRTDERGLASLAVPKGEYDLDAWKTGYETVLQTVEVTDDVTFEIQARPVPEIDPDEEQTWM